VPTQIGRDNVYLGRNIFVKTRQNNPDPRTITRAFGPTVPSDVVPKLVRIQEKTVL